EGSPQGGCTAELDRVAEGQPRDGGVARGPDSILGVRDADELNAPRSEVVGKEFGVRGAHARAVRGGPGAVVTPPRAAVGERPPPTLLRRVDGGGAANHGATSRLLHDIGGPGYIRTYPD